MSAKSKKNWIAALVGIGLLGGLAYLWSALTGVGGGPESDREMAVETPGPNEVANPAQQPEGTDLAGPGAAELAERSDAQRSAPEFPRQAQPRLTSGFAVAVLNPEGRPAAGAQVLFSPHPEGIDINSWEAVRRLKETHLRFGKLYLADDNGELFVPEPNGPCSISAHQEELWNQLAIGPNSAEPLRIELQPDSPIMVEVQGASEVSLAGVPLELRLKSETSTRAIWTGVTSGVEGQVELPHLAQLVNYDQAVGGQYSLGFAFPQPYAVTQRIDPAKLPRGRLLLAEPPTGKLTISLRDMAGRRYSGRAVVSLSRPGKGEHGAPAFKPTPEIRNRGNATQVPEMEVIPTYSVEVMPESGQAVFGRVGLGGKFHLRVTAEQGIKPVIKLIDGPQLEGEELELQVAFESGFPVLMGRIELADGTPLASARVRVGIYVGTGAERRGQHSRFISTDEDASFSLALTMDLPEGKQRFLEISAGDGSDVAAPKKLVDISQNWIPGENYLGVVTLIDPPLIASGKVTDRQGLPIAGATVRIEEKFILGEGPQDQVWVSDPRFVKETDEEGLFEFKGRFENGSGEIEPGQLRVSAGKQGEFARVAQDIERGAEDVDLILARGAGLEGSLVLDPDLPLDKLQLIIQRSGANAVPSVTALREDLSFGWDSLDQGTYDFRVVLAADPEPLFEAEGVVVKTGELTRDPRMQGIDLSGALATLMLHVVDAEGDPVPRASVFVRPAGGESRDLRGYRADAGQLELLIRRGAVDLSVYSPEHRPELLFGINEETTVTLRAGIPIVIHEDSELRSLPSDYNLSAALEPASLPSAAERDGCYIQDSQGLVSSQPHPWSLSRKASLDSDQRIALSVPEEGEYLVRWMLEREQHGRLDFVPISQKEPAVIQVDRQDSGEVQLYSTRWVSEQELAAAIRSLGH